VGGREWMYVYCKKIQSNSDVDNGRTGPNNVGVRKVQLAPCLVPRHRLTDTDMAFDSVCGKLTSCLLFESRLQQLCCWLAGYQFAQVQRPLDYITARLLRNLPGIR
jgi:hypothetical protein